MKAGAPSLTFRVDKPHVLKNDINKFKRDHKPEWKYAFQMRDKDEREALRIIFTPMEVPGEFGFNGQDYREPFEINGVLERILRGSNRQSRFKKSLLSVDDINSLKKLPQFYVQEDENHLVFTPRIAKMEEEEREEREVEVDAPLDSDSEDDPYHF